MGKEPYPDYDKDVAHFIQTQDLVHFFSSFEYFGDSNNIDSGLDFRWTPLSDDYALLSKNDVRFYKENAFCDENWICFEVETYNISCTLDEYNPPVVNLKLDIKHSYGIDKFQVYHDFSTRDCFFAQKNWDNLLNSEKHVCMGIKYLSHLELQPTPTGTILFREWRFDQIVTKKGRNCYPNRSKDCLSKRFSREDGC